MIAVLRVWRAGETLQPHPSRSAWLLPQMPPCRGPEVREVSCRTGEPNSGVGFIVAGASQPRQPGATTKTPLGARSGTCMMNVDPSALPSKSVQQTGAGSLWRRSSLRLVMIQKWTVRACTWDAGGLGSGSDPAAHLLGGRGEVIQWLSETQFLHLQNRAKSVSPWSGVWASVGACLSGAQPVRSGCVWDVPSSVRSNSVPWPPPGRSLATSCSCRVSPSHMEPLLLPSQGR